jgi:hypothetical protein
MVVLVYFGPCLCPSLPNTSGLRPWRVVLSNAPTWPPSLHLSPPHCQSGFHLLSEHWPHSREQQLYMKTLSWKFFNPLFYFKKSFCCSVFCLLSELIAINTWHYWECKLWDVQVILGHSIYREGPFQNSKLMLSADSRSCRFTPDLTGISATQGDV